MILENNKKFKTICLLGILLSSCSNPFQPPQQKPQLQSAQPIIIETIKPTVKPSESPTPSGFTANIYLIALEDNGKSGPVVGCGDSLIAVKTQVKDARAVLQLLLENHNQRYGQSGLYNALHQSDLKIDRFETNDGNIEVDLTGHLVLGGVCDNPRVSDQLEATIRQSTTDNPPVFIRINGIQLEDLLSQK
ncbi:MAG: hypothetical protein WCG34_09380 [Leptolinea sp.]